LLFNELLLMKSVPKKIFNYFYSTFLQNSFWLGCFCPSITFWGH
jgi:hypothetical protein